MIQQFTTVLKVLLATAALLFCGLLVTGNFRIGTAYTTPFGIYNSSLAGLPAYYNPALDTLAFLEYLPVFFLPIVLLIGRTGVKPLREAFIFITPWLILAIVTLFAANV